MCDCDAFVDIFLEQTALVGQVSEEFNLLPVENEELRRISESSHRSHETERKGSIHRRYQPRYHQCRYSPAYEQGSLCGMFRPWLLVASSIANNFPSNKTNRSRPRPKRTSLSVSRKTSCWIVFSSASENSATGLSKLSRPSLNSLSPILRRLWKWLPTWSRRVTLP